MTLQQYHQLGLSLIFLAGSLQASESTVTELPASPNPDKVGGSNNVCELSIYSQIMLYVIPNNSNQLDCMNNDQRETEVRISVDREYKTTLIDDKDYRNLLSKRYHRANSERDPAVKMPLGNGLANKLDFYQLSSQPDKNSSELNKLPNHVNISSE